MSYFRVPVRVWSCSGILSCVLRGHSSFPVPFPCRSVRYRYFGVPSCIAARSNTGRDAVLLRSRISGSGVRVAVRMLLYAVSGAPLSVFWLAFGPVLPVDYPGADQLVAVVPRGELPCGDAALRPVEDDVAALLRDVQHAALQRLPVADAHREAGAAARL